MVQISRSHASPLHSAAISPTPRRWALAGPATAALITWSAGGVKRSRFKTGGGSYLSSHDVREVLGLGAATKLDWLEIKWPQPSGAVERLTDVPVDRYVTVLEGKGIKS